MVVIDRAGDVRLAVAHSEKERGGEQAGSLYRSCCRTGPRPPRRIV